MTNVELSISQKNAKRILKGLEQRRDDLATNMYTWEYNELISYIEKKLELSELDENEIKMIERGRNNADRN
jgi:hypothetical protein